MAGLNLGSGRIARSGFVVSDLMALVLLLLAVLGALLDRTLLSLVGALVLAVVLFARMFTRVVLEGVHYSLTATPARVFEGDPLTLTLTIENRKRLPVSKIRVRERLPPGLVLIGREESARRTFGATLFDAVTGLGPNERVRLVYRLRALKRGHYLFGPARIEAGDPFGFYTSTHAVLRPLADLVVYPKLVTTAHIEPPLARPAGNVVARLRSVEDPNLPATARQYRPGDPVRAIDWKLTAKRDALFVRTYDASLAGVVTVLLDCDARRRGAREASPAMLEACVRTAASIACQLEADRVSFGLLANGVPPGDRARLAVPPAAGTSQLRTVLEALARVQPVVVKPLSRLLVENAPRLLPYGASVICVAAAGAPGVPDTMAVLRRLGVPVLTVEVVDQEAPAVESIRVTRHPGVPSPRVAAGAVAR